MVISVDVHTFTSDKKYQYREYKNTSDTNTFTYFYENTGNNTLYTPLDEVVHAVVVKSEILM